MEMRMACRAGPNVTEGYARPHQTHISTILNSCGGSSMDSELIPLESGELSCCSNCDSLVG